jgi:hypothetical protein
MVRLRGTTWSYAAGAPDFKGPKISQGIPGDVGYELRPTPPSAFGYTMTDLIVGMKVGGVRTVAVETRRFVQEFELLDVAPTVAQLRQRGFIGVNPPATVSARAAPVQASPEAERERVARLQERYKQAQEEKAQQDQARQQAETEQLRREAAERAVISEKYPALIARARARSKTDPVVLGIVLGETWNGIQDANNCRIKGWAALSTIPFCLYPDAEFKVPENQRWQTCVRIDEGKFDTSWIISPMGDAEVEVDGLGAALVAMAAAGERSRKCFVDVDILASGVVGKVSMPTSLRAIHVEALLTQLKSKYGSRYVVTQQLWTDGRKTAVLEWKLPDIHVRYTEQSETVSGHAFEGGSLEIYTTEWARTIDEETRRNRKPAL